MRFINIALIALTALVAPISARLIDSSAVAEEFFRQQQWEDFKVKFGKAYATAEEEDFRFQIFKENMLHAAEMNLQNPLARFGVTKFSDLDPLEFKQQYLGYRPEVGMAALERLSRPVKLDAPEFPAASAVDWRTSGAVTPVKDQGQCGSCWAFSAVEGVESAWFLKHKTLPVLSPQQVVSCDTVDAGCNGGDLPTAFDYIKSAGLTTEASYPYKSGTSGTTYSCNQKSITTIAANITGFTYATTPCYGLCPSQDEATLLKNLGAVGPSSICVDASSWSGYQGGIYSSGCSHAYTALDHCVQLVGYNPGTTTPYWIVRNSWGTSWGEDGYIYLKYGANTCGVADEATFATPA